MGYPPGWTEHARELLSKGHWGWPDWEKSNGHKVGKQTEAPRHSS